MKSFAQFLIPMALLASCGTAPSSNNGSISNNDGSISNESQPSDNRVSSIENEYDDPSLPADYKEFMALKDQALALWNENKVAKYTEDPIYYDFIDVDKDGKRELLVANEGGYVLVLGNDGGKLSTILYGDESYLAMAGNTICSYCYDGIFSEVYAEIRNSKQVETFARTVDGFCEVLLCFVPGDTSKTLDYDKYDAIVSKLSSYRQIVPRWKAMDGKQHPLFQTECEFELGTVKVENGQAKLYFKDWNQLEEQYDRVYYKLPMEPVDTLTVRNHNPEIVGVCEMGREEGDLGNTLWFKHKGGGVSKMHIRDCITHWYFGTGSYIKDVDTIRGGHDITSYWIEAYDKDNNRVECSDISSFDCYIPRDKQSHPDIKLYVLDDGRVIRHELYSEDNFDITYGTLDYCKQTEEKVYEFGYHLYSFYSKGEFKNLPVECCGSFIFDYNDYKERFLTPKDGNDIACGESKAPRKAVTIYDYEHPRE